MTCNYEVAEAFAKGRGPKKAYSVYRQPCSEGDIIYSWGSHFPMAVKNNLDKTYLINGDRYSVSTSKHQTYVRRAIADYNKGDYNSLIVPFTALRRSLNVYHWFDLHIKVIDVGQDKEIMRCLTCGIDFDTYDKYVDHSVNIYLPSHKMFYFHQLAPSTFSVTYFDKTKYYISGFDETSNGRSDGYFLSELPSKPRDIAHAFEILKPRAVKDAEKKGIKILRQGDIFAIPTDLMTIRLKKRGAFEKADRYQKNVWGYWTQATVTVVDYPSLLNTSHVATEVIRTPKQIYARGIIRHRPTEFGRSLPEHRNIKLGNKWHRIYRNTALASFSMGGRVD